MRAYSDEAAQSHNYKMRMESKQHFMAANSREAIGEIYDAMIHAYFIDDGNLAVWLESDAERYFAGVYFTNSEFNESGLLAAQNVNFRHTIDVVAREGLIGTFFKIIIEKVIPDDGVFDYFGADLNIIPRGEYGPEFITPLGQNEAAWS